MLPRGGEISMSQINVELGRSATALIGLDDAENGAYGAINTNSPSRPDAANPASMSEWYGYNHTAGPAYSCTFTGPTSVTPSAFSARGNVSVVGIPGAFQLCAYGGTNARGSSDAYFELDGTLLLAIYAPPYQLQCAEGVANIGTYAYRLYSFMSGLDAYATIACTQ